MPDEHSASVLPTIGYGAANLGNLHRAVSDEEARKILDAAWDAGVRYFDTAPHYGLGLSERRLGEFLRTKPRDSFTLSTKVGRLLRSAEDGTPEWDTTDGFHVLSTLRRRWDFTAEGIGASIQESLSRLGMDRIDLVLLHDPERYDLALAVDSALPALVGLREAGLVGSVGVGSMSADAITACVQGADLDTVMVAGRHTLIEQHAGMLDACRRTGTRIVAASVFNSGLLASAQPVRTGRYEYGDVPDDVWTRVSAIAAVCAEFDTPLPAAAMQFVLQHPSVESVVVGSSRPEQIRQNVELLDLAVPAALWTRLLEDGLIDPASIPADPIATSPNDLPKGARA